MAKHRNTSRSTRIHKDRQGTWWHHTTPMLSDSWWLKVSMYVLCISLSTFDAWGNVGTQGSLWSSWLITSSFSTGSMAQNPRPTGHTKLKAAMLSIYVKCSAIFCVICNLCSVWNFPLNTWSIIFLNLLHLRHFWAIGQHQIKTPLKATLRCVTTTSVPRLGRHD